MRHSRLGSLVLTGAALSFGTGCEEIEPYLPTVSFQNLRVDAIDFEHAAVAFEFAVANPNPVDITLASFAYALGLQDVELLSGSDADGFAIEAVGTSVLALPVDLQWTDAWNTVQATKGEDFVSFGLDGNFGFDTPIGAVLVPYDEGGEFPALRTPKFGFKRLRVERFDLATLSAELAVDLAVTNEHAGTLAFEDFAYKLSLGGNRVATGLVPMLGVVDGNTDDGLLTLPVTVDLVGAGASVVDALSSRGRISATLIADTIVQTPFGPAPLHLAPQGDVDVQ